MASTFEINCRDRNEKRAQGAKSKVGLCWFGFLSQITVQSQIECPGFRTRGTVASTVEQQIFMCRKFPWICEFFMYVNAKLAHQLLRSFATSHMKWKITSNCDRIPYDMIIFHINPCSILLAIMQMSLICTALTLKELETETCTERFICKIGNMHLLLMH